MNLPPEVSNLGRDAPPTPHRTAIVTDSNSQLTSDLRERFAVTVVPMTVTIDGVDYSEGVDLDADAFYAHFGGRRTPDVGTSQPSPGRFARVYEELADAGYHEIWSLHLSSAMSGTAASARIGASGVSIPVRVIDTGSASFGVSACVWAAGVARDRGANGDDVERRVASMVARLGSAFMIGVPHLTATGGRVGALDVDVDEDGIPVVALHAGELSILDRVTSIDDTITVMARYTREWCDRQPDGITVAIGTAEEASRSLSDRLAGVVGSVPGVDHTIHYRIGPSVGAHTGPGTFGLFVFPTIR